MCGRVIQLMTVGGWMDERVGNGDDRGTPVWMDGSRPGRPVGVWGAGDGWSVDGGWVCGRRVGGQYTYTCWVGGVHRRFLLFPPRGPCSSACLPFLRVPEVPVTL